MRVVVNTLAHVAGGTITYFRNVLPRLADDDNEYVVLVPADRRKLRGVDADNVRYREVDVPTGSLPRRFLYEQTVLPVELRREDVDVLFSPADVTTLLSPVPVVLAVHNPNPYFSPPGVEYGTSRRAKFRLQRSLTRLSVWKAERVFFVSEYSRRRCEEFFDVPDSKATTIHHGVDTDRFTDPPPPADVDLADRIDRASPYLLTVSTINPHKNYETLLRAYAALPAPVRERYPLLIAGRNSAPGYYRTLRDLAADTGIDDRVEFLGEVPDDAVPYLYDNAALYVLPSKLETFGMTLIEAMAAGTPVAAADATCIPEVVGDAAALFDPDDPEALSELVADLLDDAGRREELVRRGHRRAGEFSWETAVDRLRTLLSDAAA